MNELFRGLPKMANFILLRKIGNIFSFVFFFFLCFVSVFPAGKKKALCEFCHPKRTHVWQVDCTLGGFSSVDPRQALLLILCSFVVFFFFYLGFCHVVFICERSSKAFLVLACPSTSSYVRALTSFERFAKTRSTRRAHRFYDFNFFFFFFKVFFLSFQRCWNFDWAATFRRLFYSRLQLYKLWYLRL